MPAMLATDFCSACPGACARGGRGGSLLPYESSAARCLDCGFKTTRRRQLRAHTRVGDGSRSRLGEGPKKVPSKILAWLSCTHDKTIA